MGGRLNYRGFALHEGVLAYYTFPHAKWTWFDAEAFMKSSALVVLTS